MGSVARTNPGRQRFLRVSHCGDRTTLDAIELSSTYGFRDKIDTDDFDHPRKVFDLTDALLRRGYSDDSVTAILGGNFRRLLAGTWK